MVRSDSKIDKDWERNLREKKEKKIWGERPRKKKKQKWKALLGDFVAPASYIFPLLHKWDEFPR